MQIWQVLRCNSKNTLKLADLLEAPAQAWAPRFKTRLRPSHKRQAYVVVNALLPGFVFVPGSKVSVVDQLLKTDSRIPGCGWFLFAGEVAQIEDKQLQPLRDIERSDPMLRAHDFKLGEYVMIETGPFEGFRGKIISLHAAYIRIELSTNKLRIMIPPFLLRRATA